MLKSQANFQNEGLNVKFKAKFCGFLKKMVQEYSSRIMYKFKIRYSVYV